MPRSLVLGLFLFLSLGTLHAAQWRSSGPEGGTVRALAAAPSDPRVLYFTSGSGLHRSTDLGGTWNAINGPYHGIVTFAIDPHDPQTVYVGSSTAQLYKTRDGGATWTAIGGAPSQPAFLSSIVIDPRDTNVVYLARDCGPYFEPFFNAAGVFKSVDGGVTFSAVMNGMKAFQRCAAGLSLDPVNPDTLYAVPQYSDNGYARSDDGAQTWTTAATTLPNRVLADPRDPQKRYGSAGGLFVTSSDGGRTWISQETTALETGAQLLYGSATALTIDDRSGRLFLAGQYGVYRSGDGGRSVLSLNGPAREVTRSLVFDEASGVLIIGTETGIYRSDAFPWNDWKRLPTGDSSLTMGEAAASRTDPSTAYAISLRNIHVTRDHGRTWSNLGGALPKAGLTPPGLVSVAVDVADNVYVVGFLQSNGRNTIYKLAAGTQQWAELNPPLSRFGRIIADPGTPGVVYVIVGNGPAFMATRDGGATWSFHFTPTGDASSLAIDPRDGAVFYAGTRSSLFKSLNGGHTWIDVLPDTMIADVQISPADPNTIYAIQTQHYGIQNNRIQMSRDAGVTWTSHVAMGEIFSMVLDPRDPRRLVISVVGGTVYRSSDGGAHWESITGNLPKDSNVMRLAFSLDGRVLHAATRTRGMWELFELSRRRSVTPP